MKKIQRILILMLVVVMALGCVGCKDSKVVKETDKLPVITGEYLVKKGVSEYKLVIPAEAGSLIEVAVSEFNKFFSEATGVKLPIVTEVESGDKFISIGKTDVLATTDITYEYSELGDDGYKIVTKDDDIYLIGGSDYGSLYAVYELLEYFVDYDFFAEDSYTLATNVTELPLYDFQLTDIPDIAIRTSSDGVVAGDMFTSYRMRVEKFGVEFMNIKEIPNSMFHNSLYYVEDSEDANEKWYSADDLQLCYTAHGDEAEYQKMLNASFESVRETLMVELEKKTISLCVEDNAGFCNCDACNKIVDEYGTISATVILYTNDLNRMVRDWFETEEGKPYARDLKFVFFAYNMYEKAPCVYNKETGEYEGTNGIALDEGVYCMLAPIQIDNYMAPTSSQNEGYYENMKQWAALTNNRMYLWLYSTNFRDFIAPYNSFDHLVEYYRLAKECGAEHLFVQRQHAEGGFVTGWSNLKSYLNSKLSWDVDEDINKLTDQFFDGYFGPASDVMREVYEQFRVISRYNVENEGLTGYVYNTTAATEPYWPKDVLEKWMESFEQAEELIVDLKTKDPVKYELYRDHLNGEKLSVLYLFVECYSYNTSEDVINAYKTEFKEIADHLALNYASEGKQISEVYTKWNIN